MSRRFWTVLALAAALTTASACARVPPEQQLLIDAANALGGRDRIAALKSFAIEGEGESPNVGQNTMPDGELPVWKVTSYKRTTDLATGRTDMSQVRTAQFLFANASVQRQHQGLDGDVAVNFNADGQATRVGEQQARDRRREALQHPVTAVRAGLADGAVISNVRQQGDDDLVDIATPKGDVVTLAVSRSTKLPTSVSMMDTNPNLGDVAVVTKFSYYEDVGGVKLPRRLTTTLDKYPQFDLRVSTSTRARWRLQRP